MEYTIKAIKDGANDITVTVKFDVGGQSFLFSHGDILEYWSREFAIGITEKNLSKIGNLLKALSESDGKASIETRVYMKGVSGWVDRKQRDEVEVITVFTNNSVVRLYLNIEEDENEDGAA